MWSIRLQPNNDYSGFLNSASSTEKRKEAQEKLGELKEAKLLLEGMVKKPKRRRSRKKTRRAPSTSAKPAPNPVPMPSAYNPPATFQSWTYANTASGRSSKVNSDFSVIVTAIIIVILIMAWAG